MRIKWLGNVWRLGFSSVTKIMEMAAEWKEDEVEEDLRAAGVTHWQTKVENRNEWRKIAEKASNSCTTTSADKKGFTNPKNRIVRASKKKRRMLQEE